MAAEELSGSLTQVERERQKTEESQEIGPLPPVADPVRKESCRLDLKRYILTYFRASCYKKWPDGKIEHRGFAPYQEEMIAAFQAVILDGGKRVRAVRRGGLKSTLARIAAAWSIDYGHRRFVVLVGATDDKANEHRDNYMDMLKSSVLHKADFPEQAALLLKRANPKKQLRLDLELIDASAKDDRGCILYPNLPKSDSSEARVAPYSMRATDISGLAFVDDRGRTIRPDLLCFDDVQTPDSAKSFMLTSNRENTIGTTFMGLAGLGETIAAIMVCTVREEDDLTMRFCDRKRHPDWDGMMFPILLNEPDSKEAKEHWAQYALMLRQGDKPIDGFNLATAYYLEHRVEMDAGSQVAWELDKEPNYISALQWCMTLATLQPDYFRCEMQQKGARPPGAIRQLDAATLIKRYSGIERGVVPERATFLTAFVDSSDHVLWWAVVGWSGDFSGWIVDFGTWPDQGREQFYKEDLQRTLEHELPGASWEEAFINAHNRLDAILLERDWPTSDGKHRPIDLLLKDWSAGDHKPRILAQVMNSKWRDRIRPSKGFAPKPGRKPVHMFGDKDRDRQTGNHWVERRTEQPLHIQFDANIFKSHIARRLTTIPGAPSSLMLPGDDERSLMLLAEHLTSERALAMTFDGSEGVTWEAIPNRDNDWWDCVVGNAVAASVLGCAIPGDTVRTKKPGPKRSLAEVMNG